MIISQVLAPQGHTILVTARSDGLEQARFQESFEWLTLRPMSDAQQKQLIDMRLSQGEDAAALLDYVRSRVPLDAETGQRETGSTFAFDPRPKRNALLVPCLSLPLMYFCKQLFCTLACRLAADAVHGYRCIRA